MVLPSCGTPDCGGGDTGFVAFVCGSFTVAGAGEVVGAGGLAPGNGDGRGTGVCAGGGVVLCAAADMTRTDSSNSDVNARVNGTTPIL